MAIDFATKADMFVVEGPVRKVIAKAGLDFLQADANPTFHVWRSTALPASGSTIPYDIINFNVGGGYDPGTGVFTAPVEGVYHFKAELQVEAGGEWRLLFQSTGDKNRTTIHTQPVFSPTIPHTLHVEAVVRLLKDEQAFIRWTGPATPPGTTANNFSGHFVA